MTEPQKKIRYCVFFAVLIVVIGSLAAILYHTLTQFLEHQLNWETWIIVLFFVMPYALCSGFAVGFTWFGILKMFPSLVPHGWEARKGEVPND